MLAALGATTRSLADVLASCLHSVLGEANPLGLRPVSRAVVALVDGLGALNLSARRGHARTLAGALTKRAIATAGFPTTTASGLATLTTGAHPGEHGMVGYTVLDPSRDRVVGLISGWDATMLPREWQRSDTLFERAAARGLGAHVVSSPRFRDTPFTAAVLRGAVFHPARSIDDRVDEVLRVLEAGERGIVYLYLPELDKASHRYGWESDQWIEALEAADAALARLSRELRADEGMLVTADHGSIDIPAAQHVAIDLAPGLLDGVRHVAGEPRALQLHLEPDLSAGDAERLVERWRSAEGSRAWVVTREEAIANGWFGPRVAPEVAPRIGDLIVAARGEIAYYDTRTASAGALAMIGQHGSLSPHETRVPLLRFGAFAG